MAMEDKGGETDERIILNVDNKGGLHWRGNPVTLEQLGNVLSNQRDKYDQKMRQLGQSGVEEVAPGVKASKLFVLLRADKDTPWQHVQWLMTVMSEQKLYKLQFATKQFKDGFISEKEARELDAIDQKAFKSGKRGGQ
jgi:biopolymer transport protein ExbD